MEVQRRDSLETWVAEGGRKSGMNLVKGRKCEGGVLCSEEDEENEGAKVLEK